MLMASLRVLGLLVFISGLVPSQTMAQEAQTPSPSALVTNFYAALQSTMKEGPKLGFEGRYKKLEPVIRQTFNMPLMTRYAVGTSWRTTPAPDQEKVAEAFTRFSISTYASRFKKFDGELFEVLGEKPSTGNGVMVETKLTPKDEAPVKLNYLVRPDEQGKPRIVDVYLDASISELATRRADFGAVIEREGLPALIASLDEKSKMMASKTEK